MREAQQSARPAGGQRPTRPTAALPPSSRHITLR